MWAGRPAGAKALMWEQTRSVQATEGREAYPTHSKGAEWDLRRGSLRDRGAGLAGHGKEY